MNYLCNLDETNMQYSLAHTDDLIRFWRSRSQQPSKWQWHLCRFWDIEVHIFQFETCELLVTCLYWRETWLETSHWSPAYVWCFKCELWSFSSVWSLCVCQEFESNELEWEHREVELERTITRLEKQQADIASVANQVSVFNITDVELLNLMIRYW